MAGGDTVTHQSGCHRRTSASLIDSDNVSCYYSLWSVLPTNSHVVGQQVISEVSVIRCCLSICSLCFESNNTNLLPRLLIDELFGTSILLQIPKHSLPYNMADMAVCTW